MIGHSTSGAKSDPGDATVLADMVRTDRHNHRPVTGTASWSEPQGASPGPPDDDLGEDNDGLVDFLKVIFSQDPSGNTPLSVNQLA